MESQDRLVSKQAPTPSSFSSLFSSHDQNKRKFAGPVFWSLFATHFFFKKTGSSPVRDKTTAHLFNKSVEFHPKSGLSDNCGSSLFSEGRWMKTHTKAPRIGKLGQLTSSHLKGRSVMPMKTSPIMQLSAYGIRYPSLIAELSGEK